MLETGKLDGALAKLVEKLQEAGFDYSPELVAGMVRAIEYDGMLQIVTGFVFLFIFIALAAVFMWGVAKGFEGVTFGAGIAGFIIGLITAFTLTVENPWMKVFDSQAAFAKKIMLMIM